MATGSIIFNPEAGVVPDGSTNNLSPAIQRTAGTDSDPKKFYLTADFDPTNDEHLWFKFVMPSDYASGGSLDILWIANATSGTVRWGTKVGAITASDADTPTEHAMGAAATGAGTVNATEAYRLTTTTITLTMDSAAAGDLVFLLIYRDADGTSGTDDCSVDAKLVSARFTYTTT